MNLICLEQDQISAATIQQGGKSTDIKEHVYLFIPGTEMLTQQRDEYLEPKRLPMTKRPCECDTIMCISYIIFGDLRLITHMMSEWIVAKKRKILFFFLIFGSHPLFFPCVCVQRLNQALGSVSKDLKRLVDEVRIFVPLPILLFRVGFFS